MRLMKKSWVAAAALGAALFFGPAAAQHEPGKGKHQHGHRFDDPERWTKAFDDPARAAWQKPEEVIKALALKPDATIADIGAGTGYFAIRLARAVPTGKVYAVDLAPRMVAWLADRAKALGIANMTAVQGTEREANLPEHVDLALLVNVFHHIDARQAYFQRLARKLKPGGRVAIIETRPDAPAGPPKHMRMDVRTIEVEMQRAGYRRVEAHDLLPQQSFTVFAPVKQ